MPEPSSNGPRHADESLEIATLPDGQKVVVQKARPFLAVLPLSDQTKALDGHVLMMPVQLSYRTMSTLLAQTTVTTPFMTAAKARQLSEAMEALVHSGQLRVSQTPDGLTVGYLPGCEPPKVGARVVPPALRCDDKQVLEFQEATRAAVRKQIDDDMLVPQVATPMADLGADEPVYPPLTLTPPPASPPAQPVIPESKTQQPLVIEDHIEMNAAPEAELAEAAAFHQYASQAAEEGPRQAAQQAAPQRMHGYRCGCCGLPKKGHACLAGATDATAPSVSAEARDHPRPRGAAPKGNCGKRKRPGVYGPALVALKHAAQSMEAAQIEARLKMSAHEAETEMNRQQQQQQQQQQQAASAGNGEQPSLSQPQATRQLTWQEHLVTWQIQAMQYTSGAYTQARPPPSSLSVRVCPLLWARIRPNLGRAFAVRLCILHAWRRPPRSRRCSCRGTGAQLGCSTRSL